MTEPRNPYPSDLTDEEWRIIEPILPLDKFYGRRRSTNLREIVNAVRYREQTGCSWRMLPHDFPPWGTVYRYYRGWNRDGMLAEMRRVLNRKTARKRKAKGRRSENSARQPA